MIRIILSTLFVSLFINTAPVHADPSGSMFSREIRREAQEALNFYGFEAGTPDGIFGSRTQQAIRNFQSARGGQVTGEFSRATMGLLLESYREDRTRNSPISATTGRPQAVESAIASMAGMCGVSPASMMSRPGFLQQADLNGDGATDYLVDGSSSGCMQTCGAANCQVTVLASDGRGSYRSNDFLGYSVTSDTFDCASDGTCRFAR